MSTTDAVVVGGGLAGTVAALRLQEAGRRTLLIDKAGPDRERSSTVQSLGLIHVAQRFDGVSETPDELLAALRSLPETRARTDVSAAYAAAVGNSIRWLVGHGLTLAPAGDQPMQRNVLVPLRSFAGASSWRDGGPLRALHALAASFRAAGGVTLDGVRAERLVQDSATGAIAGLVVREENGLRTVDAKAVVLADGGFQANPALVRSSIGPFADQVVTRAGTGGTGDGLRMALDGGATTVNLPYFYGHLLHRDAVDNDLLWPYPVLDGLLATGIAVDGRGARFVDETRGGIAVANVIAWSDDPRGTWLIVDDETWRGAATELAEVMPIPPPNPALAERGGAVVSHERLDCLALAAGMSPEVLAQTVETYNGSASAGKAAHLPVPRRGVARPLAGPFHAIPMVPGITQTMGGLLIDGATRVLDADERPIAGLYAAGGTAGGLQGGGEAYVGGLSAALCLGYIAGGAAADASRR